MNSLKFPKKPYRTKGGLALQHYKNTAEQDTLKMPCPKHVKILMQMHIGAPCLPIVKKGDRVLVGQKIGDTDSFVSAPIHSSVSGTVKAIESFQLPSGDCSEAVLIESDGEMERVETTAPDVSTQEKFLHAVRESGLVGLGGAGFPAHVKLKVPEGKKIDTLIINGAECEPYITSDHREILENSWDVMSGIYTVKEMLGIKRVIIGIERNKPDAIELLNSIADNKEHDPNDEIRTLKLKDIYPQGAEKMLIQACTNRRVPPGKLPSDVGCVVMNVTSVAFLARYLKSGMPLVSKRVTVDGSAVKTPQNVIVPIGTPISELIEFCGGLKTPMRKLLFGGPMMGIALNDPNTPVLKQTNAVLAFGEEQAVLRTALPCIRCGRCIDNCPMSLMPVVLEAAVAKKNTKKLKELDLMSCIECGSCSYVCPAGRHLLHSLRTGKQLLKEAGRKG